MALLCFGLLKQEYNWFVWCPDAKQAPDHWRASCDMIYTTTPHEWNYACVKRGTTGLGSWTHWFHPYLDVNLTTMMALYESPIWVREPQLLVKSAQHTYQSKMSIIGTTTSQYQSKYGRVFLRDWLKKKRLITHWYLTHCCLVWHLTT